MTQNVPLQSLVLAPENPRKEVFAETLSELSKSIRAVGVLQNLVAYREGERYFVVGGGRRLRALEGLLHEGAISPDYPVPIRVMPREEALEAAIVENLQREDMSPAEEVEAVARLVDLVGLAEAARRTGKSQHYLRLRHQIHHRLAAEVKPLLLQGQLTWGQAEALCQVDPETQVEFVRAYTTRWAPHVLYSYLDQAIDPLFSLEEYAQAGGTVVYDLEGQPHLSDLRLAQKLQIKAIARVAEELGLPVVEETSYQRMFRIWRRPDNLLEHLRDQIGYIQERGYKVVGLTYYHNTLALVVESEETEQVQQTSTSDQKPEKTSPTISEPTRNRFWLAAEVSQAYRFAQAADVRQAMAFFVLLLIDPFAYRSPRWRWLVEGYSYNLSSGETREGWNPLLARIKEITGEKPTLQSLVENPRLEEAFCLVAGMGLGQAEQAVALTGLVNEKTLKGLPTAYLNRVLEENGLQAAKTKKEAVERIKSLPFETELSLKDAEKTS